jgi:hypothetical protein
LSRRQLFFSKWPALLPIHRNEFLNSHV